MTSVAPPDSSIIALHKVQESRLREVGILMDYTVCSVYELPLLLEEHPRSHRCIWPNISATITLILHTCVPALLILMILVVHSSYPELSRAKHVRSSRILKVLPRGPNLCSRPQYPSGRTHFRVIKLVQMARMKTHRRRQRMEMFHKNVSK